jgi:NifB/MoaA-like Fe-S oxidoreductase
MAVEFVHDFASRREELEERLSRHLEQRGRELQVTACTGVLGAEMFRRHLIEPLERMEGIEFNLVDVTNTFFGASITIAGLLTSQCFAAALSGMDLQEQDLLILPSNCTNQDGVFLDDVRLDEFAGRYPVAVERGSYDLASDLIRSADRIPGPVPEGG